MASLLERLLGRREPTSAEVARERLKLVLVTDRSELSPEKLEQMQAEIIGVIRRYLQIDEHQVHIKLEQRERSNYLVADIPLVRDHPNYGEPSEKPLARADPPEPVELQTDTQPKKPSEPPASESV